MNKKLEKLTTQYRKFTENQALTAEQLNEFIDFFEDQDRLSRTRLSGVGLLCGFKTSFVQISGKKVPNQYHVNITQGAAVTTDGDLLTLRNRIDEKGTINSLGEKVVNINIQNKNFTHYRVYNDKQGYSHFQNVKLWELRNKEEIDSDELSSFSLITPNLDPKNKIVLLYLENFVNKEEPCEDIDCDNQGEEQVANLRVLITDIKGASAIVNNDDTIYSTMKGYETLYDELPKVEVARVILSKNDATPTELKAKFENAIRSTNIGGIFTNSTKKTATKNPTGLIGGIYKIIQEFYLPINASNIENKIKSLLLNNLSADFQYRYDFLKDLVTTYNEIKSLILHLKFQCNPDINAFSKHILLGKIDEKLALGNNTNYRHDFYKATILANNGKNLKKLIFLVERFEEKVNSAFIRPLQSEIKITPSLNSVLLGKRAIPFYYDVDNKLNTLIDKWNYSKTERRKEKYNLSYHRGNLSQETFVQSPLRFSLENFDFLRIEGHLGKDSKIAYESINNIRIKYGLPFKVIVLALNEINEKENPTKPISQTEYNKRLSIISKALDLSKISDPEVAKSISILNNRTASVAPSKTEFASPSKVTTAASTSKKKNKDEIEIELLSEFMERNTGIEHRAGVDFGGTFILLQHVDTSGSSLVVADFSLPYICCSKKDPVLLSVPADKMCAYEEPIPLAVIPLDGEVKAFVGATHIPGIIKNGDQSLFAPGLIPAQYYGKTITFEVNEEAVESQIMVYPAPDVKVEIGEISYDDNAENATVTFSVSSVNNPSLSNLAFNWDFGNGKQSTAVPVNKKIQHTYELKPGEEGRFLPKVIITNTIAGENSCKTVINLEVALKLVINKNTKIRIYFDSSGSMNSSLTPLRKMRQTILKNRLLPLYGNDSDAYDRNVSVINFGDERTINALNMNNETPEGNVIVLVFQDEADAHYHGYNSTIANRTPKFEEDITKFRKRLINNFGTSNPNYYRGVVFQVDGSNMQSGTFKNFQDLMKAVELGNNSSYPTGFNLSDRNEVEFVYSVTDGGTPEYYLDLIVKTLKDLGFKQL